MDDTMIKVVITYVKVKEEEGNIIEYTTSIPKPVLSIIKDKKFFIDCLTQYDLPFHLDSAHADDYNFFRKSKKSKKYIPLETLPDFKCLLRSLDVKSHIRLTINDHTPSATNSTVAEPKQAEMGSKAADKEPEDKMPAADDSTINLTSLAEMLTDAAREKFKEVLCEITNDLVESFKTKPNESNYESTRTPGKTGTHSVSHKNVSCDNCTPDQFVPIKGLRYKCLVCKDYDLCEKCEYGFNEHEIITERHSFTHPTIKIQDSDSISIDEGVLTQLLSKSEVSNTTAVHYNVSCDSCNDDKPIVGNRYKCDQCANFDLCQKCHDDVKFNQKTVLCHNEAHSMTKMQNPRCYKNSHASRNCDDVYLDINMNGVSSDLSSKLRAMLSGGMPNFVSKFEKSFNDAQRYETLLGMVKCVEGDEDLKFGIIKSLLEKTELNVFDMADISDENNQSVNPPEYEEKKELDKPQVIESLVSPVELTEGELDCEAEAEAFIDSRRCDSILVNLSLKSNGMAQITVFNNTDNLINCSDLTLEIVNFLGHSVCKVIVHKRHGIESLKTAKFNIALNAAHLKHPFKLIFDNTDFKAVADLSLKNLASPFKVEKALKEESGVTPEEVAAPKEVKEDKGTQTEQTHVPQPSEEEDKVKLNVDTESETELNTESDTDLDQINSIGSTSSMVLPSLPKETSSSIYIDAESETDHGNDEREQEMSIDVSGDECELGSDYEILTPTTSNYN